MAKEFKITSTRLSDLEKELNYLKTTREREIAAMIAEARSYGDLSENSETMPLGDCRKKTNTPIPLSRVPLYFPTI